MNSTNRLPLDAKAPQLKQWHAKPAELIISAAADWAIILTAWLMMSYWDSMLITVVGIIIIASRLHALGAFIHDACHVDYRQKTIKWWIVEAFAGWPISTTTEAMRYHHLRHHRYTGTIKDPYLPPKLNNAVPPKAVLYARGLLLPTWWTLRPIVGLAALLLPQLRTPYAQLFLQDRSGEHPLNNKEVIDCAKADMAQLWAHALVTTAVLAYQLPFLTTYLIPIHITSVLNARRVTLEHPAATRGDVFGAAIPTTDLERYTISSDNSLSNWLLTPRNLGLHFEHHRYPAVACKHLPKVKALLANHTTN